MSHVLPHAPTTTTPTETASQPLFTNEEQAASLSAELETLNADLQNCMESVSTLQNEVKKLNKNMNALKGALDIISSNTNPNIQFEHQNGQIDLAAHREQYQIKAAELTIQKEKANKLEQEIQAKMIDLEKLKQDTPQEQGPDLVGPKILNPAEVTQLQENLNTAEGTAKQLNNEIAELSCRITVKEIARRPDSDIESGQEIVAESLEALQSQKANKEEELKTTLATIKTTKERLFQHSFASNPVAWKILAEILNNIDNAAALSAVVFAAASSGLTYAIAHAASAKTLERQANNDGYIDNPLTPEEDKSNTITLSILSTIPGGLAGYILGGLTLTIINKFTTTGEKARYYGELFKALSPPNAAEGTDIEMAGQLAPNGENPTNGLPSTSTARA